VPRIKLGAVLGSEPKGFFTGKISGIVEEDGEAVGDA